MMNDDKSVDVESIFQFVYPTNNLAIRVIGNDIDGRQKMFDFTSSTIEDYELFLEEYNLMEYKKYD